MTQAELDQAFAGVEDAKGLPGTKLEFFLRDFRAYVQELSAYPHVSITHLHLQPSSEEIQLDLRILENSRGITIPDEIKSLYNQVYRLQLRWIHHDHPRFDRNTDQVFRAKPFADDLVDQEMGRARYINITTFDHFLQKVPGVYLDFKQADGLQLYYLNYNSHFSHQLAVNINKEAKELELYTGDDYFADAWKLDTDFGTYLYQQIQLSDQIVATAAKE
ncbi:MAG: hypothetical protein MJA82_16525 [Clostridia bacterium]|nr:hypothetical protein [Clostridia bacterium]